MNSFYNPLFVSKVIKSYLFDINRLKRVNDARLRRYQDRQFKKMVEFAYTVPLYRDKFSEKGLKPNEVKGLKDIDKLPFLDKKDFKKYYPDGLISNKVNRDNLIEVSTSGTTGKSLSIFVSLFDIVKGLFGYIRKLREYNINWRKHRLSIIGDFAPHTVETGYINKGLETDRNFRFLFKNIQWLDTNDDPEKVIEKLNDFDPYFIGGYTGMLGHLALLKTKGMGRNVSPHVIASTGAPLDRYLKKFIQDAFNSEIFESYGSTETGPIAFHCRNNSYHVLSDYVFLEYFDEDKPVKPGDAGEIVVTKLYGNGTPILRYTAMKDIVQPSQKNCGCNLSGDLIDKIYGRKDLGIYLPDGKMLLPSSWGRVYSKVLYDLKTNRLRDTQIIQHSLDEIEIKVKIKHDSRETSDLSEKIIGAIKSEFIGLVGSDVNVTVKEVDEIKRKKDEARVNSHVEKKDFRVKKYL
ncbi:MAG: hypothetical protein V5A68_00880 [Candidatus Thermoplasmatota archaeon]